MTNYAIQDGCHNCKHCLIRCPPDDPYFYYCKLTQKYERPIIEPQCPDESLFDWHERHQELDDWIWHLVEVEPAGKCDGFERITT